MPPLFRRASFRPKPAVHFRNSVFLYFLPGTRPASCLSPYNHRRARLAPSNNPLSAGRIPDVCKRAPSRYMFLPTLCCRDRSLESWTRTLLNYRVPWSLFFTFCYGKKDWGSSLAGPPITDLYCFRPGYILLPSPPFVNSLSVLEFLSGLSKQSGNFLPSCRSKQLPVSLMSFHNIPHFMDTHFC